MPGRGPSWDAALARLDAVDGLLHTYLGTERVARRRSRLELARSAWNHVVTGWGERDGVELDEHGTSRAGVHTGWSDVRPSEIAETYVLPVLREAPQRVRKGGLWLLVELGRGDLAQTLVAANADFGPAATKDLLAELAAQRERKRLGRDASAKELARWSAQRAGTDTTLLWLAPDDVATHPVFPLREIEFYFDSWGGTPPPKRR